MYHLIEADDSIFEDEYIFNDFIPHHSSTNAHLGLGDNRYRYDITITGNEVNKQREAAMT
jgi:hypothetical protein